MTPFESLLWNVWLPKVRTTINNEWSAQSPDSAVKLYEAWSTFLPPFIRDNLLDQLLLPKVQKAVADWSPKMDDVSLQTIVFPWLPYVGLRLEDFVDEARRKVKHLLRHWTVGDEVPKDLVAWKDVSTHPLFVTATMTLNCYTDIQCWRLGQHVTEIHCAKTWRYTPRRPPHQSS